MPISLPGAFRQISFQPLDVVGASVSPWSLQSQVFAHQGQAWTAQVAYPVKQRADAEPVLAALLSLNGPAGTFLLGDPLGQTPRGTAAVEPASSNEIENNTMVGAVAGVIGSGGAWPSSWAATFNSAGWTVDILGTGAEDGIDYIEVRLHSPTSTGQINIGFISTTSVAAVQSETFTGSVYVVRSGGTQSDIGLNLSMGERDGGGGFLSSDALNFTAGSGTLAANRVANPHTLVEPSAVFLQSSLIVSAQATTTPDITLRIGLPQLEQRAAASAPIKTVDAGAVARPAGPAVFGAAQSGQSLATWGWPSFGTASLLAGDYIQLGSGETQRLHKLTADLAADVEGKATLPIWPRLRESPADQETIVIQDCEGVFNLPADFPGWRARPGGIYEPISFAAVETLRGP